MNYSIKPRHLVDTFTLHVRVRMKDYSDKRISVVGLVSRHSPQTRVTMKILDFEYLWPILNAKTQAVSTVYR